MSFDLINASAIFQVYINYVLCDLVDNFCIVYLDDILVFSKSEEEHYQHLQLIIKCLQHTELYANLKKCKFFKSKVEYLDFLINENNLYMNLSCVQMISDYAITHLRFFIIYRFSLNFAIFIDDLSTILLTLHDSYTCCYMI